MNARSRAILIATLCALALLARDSLLVVSVGPSKEEVVRRSVPPQVHGTKRSTVPSPRPPSAPRMTRQATQPASTDGNLPPPPTCQRPIKTMPVKVWGRSFDRVDPRFVRDPATGSVGPRRPMDMFFKPPPVCDKWIARARAYEQEVQAPYAATGAGSKGAMVHVFDRKDAGGYGSWLKGLVTMYIAAVLRGVPYSVVADSPPLERLFTSAHFVARDLAEKRDGAYFDRAKSLRIWCPAWLPDNGKAKEEELTNFTTLNAAIDGARVGPDGRLFVVCDRNLIPLMQQDSVMGPALDAIGLGRERYPADVYGCAFHTLMQPKQHVVEQAKRAVRRHGYFLGVQVRRGGKAVKWADPSRIPRRQGNAAVSCVKRFVNDFIGNTTAEGCSTVGGFVTTDSQSVYGAVDFPAQHRIEFKPQLFFHTALSRVASKGSQDPYIELDEKIAIDHLIFAFADEKLGTRSAFSETAVWASFSSAVTRYVHDVCLHAPGPDCAATVTLC